MYFSPGRWLPWWQAGGPGGLACPGTSWGEAHFVIFRVHITGATLPQENGDPYVVLHTTLLLIFSFVTKIRWFDASLTFFKGGKYDYWHSNNIIKPKCKLQPHLALQQDVFEEEHITKEIDGPIIFEMAIWEPLIYSPYRGSPITVIVQGSQAKGFVWRGGGGPNPPPPQQKKKK